MKMQFNSGVAVVAASLLIGAGSCTKNFEQYNTNPAELTTAQTIAALPTAFGPLEQNIYHNYQTAQNLSADAYGGYFMPPTPFKAQDNLNYFLVDGWDVNGFNDQYDYEMAILSKMRADGVPTARPDYWAVALIMQVEAMDRVTDRFGPIPYSKAGTSVTSVPYDSQQSVYSLFFLQLDTAVANLDAYIAANPGVKPLGANDLVYGGDYTAWIKFANSLRLRLAMRIVKVDPTTAQAQAEVALNDPGGVMTVYGDDALVAQSGGRSNDIWTVTSAYGNNNMNAALMTYMVGFKDPRLSVYATPATDSTVVARYGPGYYQGIRIGINLNQTLYENCALPNCTSPTPQKAPFGQTAPQYIMTAAEVWFLKAEAALRGWANAGVVQTDYETGINTSFLQWGVSSSTYLHDASSTEVAYMDPQDSVDNSSPALSTITIAWDPTASNETALERIITQKWIAMFPDGQEAWADYRRTGYPRLFPVVNNFSGGTISTTTQIRRLAYPSNEYTTNGAAVNTAVSTLLGGPDVGGTRLWWDVANKGNF
jgi:Susd and RagB outer membrane lipoprotein